MVVDCDVEALAGRCADDGSWHNAIESTSNSRLAAGQVYCCGIEDERDRRMKSLGHGESSAEYEYEKQLCSLVEREGGRDRPGDADQVSVCPHCVCKYLKWSPLPLT